MMLDEQNQEEKLDFVLDDLDDEDESIRFWIRMVKTAIKNLELEAESSSQTRLSINKSRRQIDRQRQDQYRTAVHWLFISNDTDAGSFQWVCDWFGIDVDAARIAVLSRKYGKENAKSMLALYNRFRCEDENEGHVR